ncbi:MAG: NADP-dependent malic enzyme [Flavobacteriales bacterium]|nr:NADP-dependent malic enzyme [Flavobacteriales bacterium]
MTENEKLKKDALEYHSKKPKGKIEVIPTKPHATQRDLSLAYSPGVAEPCLEIAKDKSNVYKYTSKGNLVAVISNGTAVLGLGDIGAEASKPVMEGKGLLFKIFAGIDVFDIEIDEKDPKKFIDIVKAIAPTFGGINLEDIKAPEAFEIEQTLKKELSIPVMHDDQHGTAIISAAALLNALEIAEKKIDEVIFVVNGAGAAAIACTKIYMHLGAKLENIYMCDSKGVIHSERNDLNEEKKEFALKTDKRTLEEVMNNADVFIGLSKGNVVSPEMLKSMNENPIVFAMANPTPEIDYNLAVKTRKDVIMATGRSDFPNQVNNVLGFPYIFRGALDVQATCINEEMKLAAVHALAELAKEPVPEMVRLAYNSQNLNFGKEYIIPKPFDNRLITKISEAVAKAAIESGVAKNPITDWKSYEDELIDKMGGEAKLIRMLQDKAKSNPKTILLNNAEEYNILKAAQILQEEGIAKPILLGNKQKIKDNKEEFGIDTEFNIIDLHEEENHEQVQNFINLLAESRKRKGVSPHVAKRLLQSRDYFGSMMVKTGQADTMISGFSKSFGLTLRNYLECINTSSKNKISGMTIVLTEKGPLFFADTSVITEPSTEDLIRIAKMTAEVVKSFGIEPRIAMLSFENFSAKSETSKTMANAVSFLHTNHPDLIVDGEIQADFALKEELLNNFKFSKLAEVHKTANILVFPDLTSANISYKILRGLDAAQTVGPILLGLEKPMHITQMRASVDELVNLATYAVIDCQNRENKKI